MVFSSLICTMGVVVGIAGRAPVEISARTWFNARTVQVPDERTYVVFFFSTIQGKKENPRYIARLHKMRKNREVVVIGLSAESSKRVQKFVKENKVRFSVGAESKAYKQFRIKKFPAIVVLDPSEKDRAGRSPLTSLDDLDDYVDFPDEDEVPPLVSGEFSKESSVEVLEDHARNDTDETYRLRSLSFLRKKMAPGKFMKLCDELLAATSNFGTSRGNIAYLRHLADPTVKEKEPRSPPSSDAKRARRVTLGGPQWQRVRDFEELAPQLSQEKLMAELFDDQTDPTDPRNLLNRLEIGSIFNGIADNGTAEEKATARELLMQMLPGEPDAGVRLYLVGALWGTAYPGDIEVAEFLEEQLKTEPNIRSVRPMMETIVRCMRTGEGPCDDE